MTSAVVDANVFKLVYDELVLGTGGEASIFIQALFLWGHIAFDEKGLVEQEWVDTSCGANDEFFRTWVSARVLENKIQLYSDCCHVHAKKEIGRLGVPNKDRKYIYLAVSAKARALFSHDIDLYEPKAKSWPEAKKKKLKDESSGCVCAWLHKNHGVVVCQMNQHADVLC